MTKVEKGLLLLDISNKHIPPIDRRNRRCLQSHERRFSNVAIIPFYIAHELRNESLSGVTKPDTIEYARFVNTAIQQGLVTSL